MGTKVSGLGVERDFGKHVSQRAPYAHKTAKFFYIKGAFINVSTGAPDAGKPIKLDSSGKIDSSMYEGGANHNLLSAVHPDTVVGSPVRGDLIVGNATPKWEKIALGTIGKFLRSDGSDALWTLLVVGDLPSHSHAWADVSKTGSNLTDLVTRNHAGLQTITENQHHNKLHSMVGVQHSASGLTIGYVIRASGATTFVWAQLQHGDLGGISVDQHHDEAHILVSAKHTASGLTVGYVIRASGATTFVWAQLGHGDLGGVTVNQHHDEAHILVSAKHTASGLTIGHVLTATSPTAFAFQALSIPAGVPHPFLFVGY